MSDDIKKTVEDLDIKDTISDDAIGNISEDLDKSHSLKVHDNINIMNWFSRGSFDAQRSKETRIETITQTQALLKADTFKLKRDLATYLSVNGIKNHDWWLDQVSKIIVSILGKSVENINNLFDTVENSIINGEERNHKTILRARDSHARGVIDSKELEEKEALIRKLYQDYASALREDLNVVYKHQSNNLKLAVENFIEAEGSKVSGNKGFKVSIDSFKK